MLEFYIVPNLDYFVYVHFLHNIPSLLVLTRHVHELKVENSAKLPKFWSQLKDFVMTSFDMPWKLSYFTIQKYSRNSTTHHSPQGSGNSAICLSMHGEHKVLLLGLKKMQFKRKGRQRDVNMPSLWIEPDYLYFNWPLRCFELRKLILSVDEWILIQLSWLIWTHIT